MRLVWKIFPWARVLLDNPSFMTIFLFIPSQEGRLAIVTDAGRDAMDAAASGADEAAGRIPLRRVRELPMKR